jgi:hypothetical protein
MTAPQPVPRIAGDRPGPGEPGDPTCPACPHPAALHDAIGARFCRATMAKALSRGCVCAKH